MDRFDNLIICFVVCLGSVVHPHSSKPIRHRLIWVDGHAHLLIQLFMFPYLWFLLHEFFLIFLDPLVVICVALLIGKFRVFGLCNAWHCFNSFESGKTRCLIFLRSCGRRLADQRVQIGVLWFDEIFWCLDRSDEASSSLLVAHSIVLWVGTGRRTLYHAASDTAHSSYYTFPWDRLWLDWSNGERNMAGISTQMDSFLLSLPEQWTLFKGLLFLDGVSISG